MPMNSKNIKEAKNITDKERISQLTLALETSKSVIKNASEKEAEHLKEKANFVEKMEEATKLISEQQEIIENLEKSIKDAPKKDDESLKAKDDEISKLKQEIDKLNLEKEDIKTKIEGDMVSEAVLSAHKMKDEIIADAKEKASNIEKTAKEKSDKYTSTQKERAKREADTIIVTARTEADKIKKEVERKLSVLNKEAEAAENSLSETLSKIEEIKDIIFKVNFDGLTESNTVTKKTDKPKKSVTKEVKESEKQAKDTVIEDTPESEVIEVIEVNLKEVVDNEPDEKVVQIPKALSKKKTEGDEKFNQSFQKLDSLLQNKKKKQEE